MHLEVAFLIKYISTYVKRFNTLTKSHIKKYPFRKLWDQAVLTDFNKQYLIFFPRNAYKDQTFRNFNK